MYICKKPTLYGFCKKPTKSALKSLKNSIFYFSLFGMDYPFFAPDDLQSNSEKTLWKGSNPKFMVWDLLLHLEKLSLSEQKNSRKIGSFLLGI